MDGPLATRRTVLTAIGGVGLALAVRPAQATPETMKSAIRQVIGEAAVKPGRIKIALPPLVENGNTVAMAVSVDSPMTANDQRRARAANGGQAGAAGCDGSVHAQSFNVFK